MRKLAWLILVVAAALPACHHGKFSEVRGSGKRELQKRQVAPFTAIDAEGAFVVEITCQKDQSLEIEGDDNVLNLVSSEVSNKVLHLKNIKGYSVSEPVRIRISVPNIEGLTVSGADKIDVKEMKNDRFEIDSKGAPYITVSGSTKVFNLDSSGAGTIDAEKLRASKATVDSKGASVIDLYVADQLDVTISGPSSVTYKGDPVVNKTVHGPGRVERRSGEGA